LRRSTTKQLRQLVLELTALGSDDFIVSILTLVDSAPIALLSIIDSSGGH